MLLLFTAVPCPSGTCIPITATLLSYLPTTPLGILAFMLNGGGESLQGHSALLGGAFEVWGWAEESEPGSQFGTGAPGCAFGRSLRGLSLALSQMCLQCV